MSHKGPSPAAIFVFFSSVLCVECEDKGGQCLFLECKIGRVTSSGSTYEVLAWGSFFGLTGLVKAVILS